MTERASGRKLTLTQWDAATTEQRGAWLKQGYYLSMEDAAVLQERKDAARAVAECWTCDLRYAQTFDERPVLGIAEANRHRAMGHDVREACR